MKAEDPFDISMKKGEVSRKSFQINGDLKAKAHICLKKAPSYSNSAVVIPGVKLLKYVNRISVFLTRV